MSDEMNCLIKGGKCYRHDRDFGECITYFLVAEIQIDLQNIIETADNGVIKVGLVGALYNRLGKVLRDMEGMIDRD